MQKSTIQAIAKRPLETLHGMKKDEIAKVIQYANYQYYNTDKPVFTDNVFDLIKDHLQELDPFNPILKHVGAVVCHDERKVKLPYWMGSMDKVKSEAGVDKWVSKFQGDVVVSDKLDGISGMFHWKKGEAHLFTRGNGEEGQTITHILPFILNIPDKAMFQCYDELTVRGELIINKQDFIKMKDLGANSRNTVSGVLNAKLPNLEIAKRTQFIAYELIVPNHKPVQQMKLMRGMGFKVVPNSVMKTKDVSNESLSTVLGDRRKKSEFDIDGIIVVHDGVHSRKSGENPKHAFAFKSVSMMDRVEVVVTSVDWKVSKDGLIKPVVVFEPVSLSGAMVGRATGFNAKFIVENHIGVGAKIVVMRSGDVIPHIIQTIEKAEPDLPDLKFEWNETGIDIVANATDSKDEIQAKNLEFFFRNAKVSGLSSGLLAKFTKSGLDTVGKIMKADKQQLLEVDGIQEKMATKLLEAIKSTFEMGTLEPVVLMEASNAFGRGLGEKKLKLISDKYPQVLTDEKVKLTIEQLVEIAGIEKKTAAQFLSGLTSYWKFANANDLVRFHRAPTKTKQVKSAKEQVLKDVAFLFTGVRSKEAEKFIVERGGVIKSSMSKNVDFLICKDTSATSSKMKEARELGIEIVSLDEFMKKYDL